MLSDRDKTVNEHAYVKTKGKEAAGLETFPPFSVSNLAISSKNKKTRVSNSSYTKKP